MAQPVGDGREKREHEGGVFARFEQLLTEKRTWRTTYLLASALVALAAFVRWIGADYLAEAAPMFAFTLAVLGAAVIGGPGPALFATALSVLAMALFFEPVGSLTVDEPLNRTRLAIFALLGCCFALVGLRERRNRAQLAGAFADARNSLSARVEAEQSKALSEGIYRAIGESMLYGVWVCDAEGRNIYSSPSLLDLVGLTQAQSAGFDWASALHPDDREATLAAWTECVRTGTFWERQQRYLGKDGKYHHVLARGVPIRDASGAITAWAGINLDIRALKEVEEALRRSENELRTLANASPNIVWAARPDGYIDYFNERWYEFTGFARDEFGAETRLRIMHPDDRERAKQTYDNAIEEVRPYDVEYRFFDRASGSYRWFLGRAAPLLDERGAVVRWFGTSTDIDDLRRAESERERLLDSERTARVAAERAGRLKDEFLATLSHELRTPLNAILGWTHLLRNDLANVENVRQAADVIERNARVQTQLIADLLDMSRIISGKMRLEAQPVALPAVIEAALASLRPAADAKGVRVTSTLELLSDPVHGDAARLQQIVWNLVSNAIKFTSRDGRVDVVLARVDAQVEIRVSDSGIGIDPAFLPHVFERFRQADASSSREHTGLGIGLALVKHLAEAHGGRVRATSAGKDQGATFVVELPLAITDRQPMSGRAHARVRPAIPGEQSPVDLSGLKVLVVDDEADALEMVKRVLQGNGAEVACVASADQALERLGEGRFDVLLSDIGMPRRDGFELILEARRRGHQLPAAALTAFARAEDRARALLCGFQAHVTKPIEPSELIATVAELGGRNGS